MTFVRAVLAGLILTAAGSAALAQASLDGIWTSSAQVNGQAVPFTLQISGDGDAVAGALSTAGRKRHRRAATLHRIEPGLGDWIRNRSWAASCRKSA